MQQKSNPEVACIFVTRPGFEPRQAESESDVLPLHYRAIIKNFFVTPQGLEPWAY